MKMFSTDMSSACTCWTVNGCGKRKRNIICIWQKELSNAFTRLPIPVVLLEQVQASVFGFLLNQLIGESGHEQERYAQGFQEETSAADMDQHRHFAHEWPKGFQLVLSHALSDVSEII